MYDSGATSTASTTVLAGNIVCVYMYVCMYVCMYLYICMYVCIYMQININIK